MAPAQQSVGGVISRETDAEFTLENGIPGVGIVSSVGGGCTVGTGKPDGTLVLLAALAALGLIRRRYIQRKAV